MIPSKARVNRDGSINGQQNGANPNHPWRQRAVRQVEAQRRKKNGEPAAKPGPKSAGWSCPSCGSVSCDFGECQMGDF